MEIFLNFMHQDLRLYDAKFGLVKFEATALISLYRALNFSIFRVLVSATQICKFERKNDKTKYCEMIFRVLKQN